MARKNYTWNKVSIDEAYDRIHDAELGLKSVSKKDENPCMQMVTNNSYLEEYREVHHIEECTVVISNPENTRLIEIIGKLSKIKAARDRLADTIEDELVEI